MKLIWKFTVSMGLSVVAVPRARIIAFGMQDTPVFWCEVERPVASSVVRTFDIFPTGHEVPDGWEWRATLQDDPFVWHVYEKQP